MSRACLFCGCQLLDFPLSSQVRLRQRICQNCWTLTLELSAEELAQKMQIRESQLIGSGTDTVDSQQECYSGL